MIETEKKTEKYLRDQAKKFGGLALKWVSPGFTGAPDRIVLLPGGRIFFAEIKGPKGKLSPRQEYVKKQITKLGFKYYTINSKQQVNDIIQNEI